MLCFMGSCAIAIAERFKKFAKSLEDRKHMVNRDIGRLETSPSLKHHKAA